MKRNTAARAMAPATGNTLPSHGRHQVEERPRANLLLPAAPRPLR
ncbi:MAG: hypothetical protein ACKO45_07155 [Cyanobium sp.]